MLHFHLIAGVKFRVRAVVVANGVGTRKVLWNFPRVSVLPAIFRSKKVPPPWSSASLSLVEAGSVVAVVFSVNCAKKKKFSIRRRRRWFYYYYDVRAVNDVFSVDEMWICGLIEK